VLEGWVSPGAAERVYGVVLRGEPGPADFGVDEGATARRRGELRGAAS